MNETNKKERMMESASGYAMPFASEAPVQIALDYGEQIHPHTGNKFNHHGVDFIASHIPLYALATGNIVGIGNESVHQNYLIVRYGKYEVKYGHISEAFCRYGAPVTAGQAIATSGDFLHFEVKFDGVEIDPKEFCAMLLANVQQLESMGIRTDPYFVNMGSVPVQTDYDKDQEEITQMMLSFLPRYLNDIQNGTYQMPNRMQQTLRNVFAQSANKNYFFEEIPNIGNPLGLSRRAAPMAGKVQNLIIGDFLNYMALRHDTYLSSWDEGQKKNFRSKLQKME